MGKFKEPKKGSLVLMKNGDLGIVTRIGIDVIEIDNNVMINKYHFSDLDEVWLR